MHENGQKRVKNRIIPAESKDWETKEPQAGFCIRFDIYFDFPLCYAVDIM